MTVMDVWPLKKLFPTDTRFDLWARTTGGGVPLSGVPQIGSGASPLWVAKYGAVNLYSVDTIKIWRALAVRREGRLIPLLVPIDDRNRKPYPADYTGPQPEAPWGSRVTATFVLPSPGAVNATAHGLAEDDPFQFATTDTLPTPLVAGTTYYVLLAGLGLDSFFFATSPGGAFIPLSAPQAGTHAIIAETDLWSDGAGFYQPSISARVNDYAAVRATQLSIDLDKGSALEPGHYFSLRQRLYQITRSTDEGSGQWTIKFRPPLREAVVAGETANFDGPVCRMRLTRDDGMGADLQHSHFGSPDVDFIEDPSTGAVE